MENSVIDLGNIKAVLTRKPIKSIRIKVTLPAADVRVSAPLYTDIKTIQKFVLSKRGWIEGQISKILNSKTAKPQIENGGTIYLRGKKYPVEVKRGNNRAITFAENRVTVTLKDSDTAENAEKLLSEFYRNDLKDRAARIFFEEENNLNLKRSGDCIRDMKTRWGSCNIKTGKITLSLYLARYSDRSLRYVITHELLHLKYPDHGKNFKAAMTHYCPEWREIRKELNANED